MLEKRLEKHIDLLLKRYPKLESSKGDIIKAYLVFEECYLKRGKILIAGNGGSAADAEHMVGELMKSFKMPRKITPEFSEKLREVDAERGKILEDALQRTLTAIALDGHIALSTAYMNDCNPVLGYAQQVNGFGEAGDVFLGISTSGNSENILYAATVAKAKGMKVVGLAGVGEGKLRRYSDVYVNTADTETYMIQELHLPIYHCWCLMLEEKFFGQG